VVQDNLSTHTPGSLHEAFPAESILERLEFHYTPKARQLAQHGRDRSNAASRRKSDDRRPPLNPAVSFLPRTAGNQNGRVVWSIMARVAGSTGGQGWASTTESDATSVV
jgi:hypothetical protein